MAWSGGTSNGGYEDPDSFAGTVRSVRSSSAGATLGGVMLWDGPYAHLTTGSSGKDYIDVVKGALTS